MTASENRLRLTSNGCKSSTARQKTPTARTVRVDTDRKGHGWKERLGVHPIKDRRNTLVDVVDATGSVDLDKDAAVVVVIL
jgi:hypothetical protein